MDFFILTPLINNGAHMIRTDIATDNGIIHVLNSVLMPNMELNMPRVRNGLHDHGSHECSYKDGAT